jgi:small subunit ribosomal protein S6
VFVILIFVLVSVFILALVYFGPGLYYPKGGYMRRYETIAIVDPDVSPEARVPLFERCEEIISQQNGMLVMLDEWGTRKLAYEIRKKLRGYYVRYDYCGNGGLVQEMERFFRIDERVLKFLTVLIDDDVDPEKVKEELAQAEAKKFEPKEGAEKTSEDAESSEAPDIIEIKHDENTEPETEEEK